MYQLQVSDRQLELIKNACEYLGRHLIWQHDFKSIELEDWAEDKHKTWQTLLDIRKVVMHEYCKGEQGSNIHSFPVYKMWNEPLMEIYPITIKEWQ